MGDSEAHGDDSGGLRDKLRRLEDRAEISELKAKYFRAVDTHDWTLLRSLFVDDAQFETGAAPSKGASDWVRHVSGFHEGGWSAHHGHLGEIVVDGDSAEGTWANANYLGRANGDTLREYLRYHERYVRTPDGWRIASISLSHLHVDRFSKGEVG